MRYAGIVVALVLALGLGGAVWILLPFAQRPAYYEMSAAGETSCVLLDERTRGILIKGLDDALHDYIKNSFAIMLQDKVGGPARAIAGIRPAVEFHNKAIEALKKPCI